jgi:hypothetical protein
MWKEEIKNVVHSCNKKEIRKFSFTIGIFLIIAGLFLLWQGIHWYIYVIFIAFLILVAGLLFPVRLKPFYIIWMSFAVVLGYIMTRVILTIIFYSIFAPVGLVLRILKKDILHQRFDQTAQSYWIKREKRKFDPKDAERQF